MPAPLLSPGLFLGLFNMKPLRVRLSDQGAFRVGSFDVTVFGEDRVSMIAMLSALPNQNQFVQVLPGARYNVSQEMLDKVVAENGGQSFFADWRNLELLPPVANN